MCHSPLGTRPSSLAPGHSALASPALATLPLFKLVENNEEKTQKKGQTPISFGFNHILACSTAPPPLLHFK